MIALVASGTGEPLPALTGQRILTAWVVDPYLAVPLLVVAAGYLLGVRRLRRRGVPWPVGRSAAFLAGGLGSLAVATMSSLGAYDDVLFSIHMVQHMVLTMLTPVFLALGAPVTLALRALHGRGRRALLGVLHSPVVRVLTHPVATLPLLMGSLYGLYFTPVYEVTLRHPLLHEALHVHFVVVGCLFFFPLLGVDPLPHPLPHVARLGVVFLMLPMHAWLGVTLMMSTQTIAADYYAHVSGHATDLLADQHLGGAILWASGDLLSSVFFGALLVRWIRADERAARRGDRRADVAAQRGHVDPELAAYNAYLARLHTRDRPQRQGR